MLRLTERIRWRLLCVVPIIAFALSVLGIANERPVLWDETRPSVELFIRSPMNFLLVALESALGRPGFPLLALIGLLFGKVAAPFSSEGFPEMPLLFQSALHALSCALVMLATWQWSRTHMKRAFAGAVLAGIAYATCPITLHYTHRMLPPVYVTPILLGAVLLIHHGIISDKRRLCFVAGVLLGCSFLTYPGVYHLLLAMPLLVLLSKELRHRRFFLVSCMLIVAGAGTVLLSVELAMQCVKHTTSAEQLVALRTMAYENDMARGPHMGQPTYYTYMSQLADLSKTIRNGDPRENGLFVARFAYAARDVWLPICVGLLLVGLFNYRAAGFSACVWVLGVYLIWLVNGPILGREVLYGRVVVLSLPLLYMSAGLVVCRLQRFKRLSIGIYGVVIATALISTFGIVTHRPIRVHDDQVKRDIASAASLPIDSIEVISSLNDYTTPELSRKATQWLQSYEAQGNKKVFVAFNLHYPVLHPARFWLEFQSDPLLRYHSPMREPMYQFEGHTPDERTFIRAHPEVYDIKVYSLEELKEQLQRSDYQLRSLSGPHQG